MKKFLISCFALVGYLSVTAQVEIDYTPVIDVAEDTTQVYTITDIIEMQERVSRSTTTEAHFASVWGRKTFFNFGYNYSGSMNPKGNIPLGISDHDAPEFAPDFKSDWGLMLQLGHSYALHKKPIANIVQFNLDYTFIDLNFNSYKEEEYADEYEPSTNPYMPWAADKYDLIYGMTIGPSVTVAPLTMLENRQLHFFKFNIYYHIGYHAGLLLMDQENDSKKKSSNFDYLAWSHGFSQSFGFSLSWKNIGLGWETRSYSPRYKDLSGSSSSDTYKFKNTSGRIYLTIRY